MESTKEDKIPEDDFLLDCDIKENDDFTEEIVLTPPPMQPVPLGNQVKSQYGSSFNPKSIERLMYHFNKKYKHSQDSCKILSELMRVYTIEILTRAGDQAIKEESSSITMEHLEKILPQLLLDFN